MLWEVALQNLTSPPVLAFALGLIAVAIKSDLRLPEAVYQALSIYLLLGIGIKGGVALSQSTPGEIWLPILGALGLGLVVPWLAFQVLGLTTKLDQINRGAVAAHYGSTSLVTFTAALIFLDAQQIFVEGYVTTLLAILEIPGIIVGLMLASKGLGRSVNWGESLREVLTARSIVLLAGGLALGLITGTAGYTRIEPFFGALFTGVLTLFLLEMGIVAGRRIPDIKSAGIGLVGFSLGFPLLAGSLGVLTGHLTGMGIGGSAVLGVLTASASYIAAPAAVRLALPEASPGIYLTASLGITFPFNLIVGIPLMVSLSGLVEGLGL
ncbi:sodium-dependent bicarbonate transport family permease [Aquiluna sp. KACHI24]|uniref:sodium-dependent bicarbonate transport family permease n=1 Tax=Aquiluna sp. KACHI24 TaxID=2968831 RepID=UPI0021FA1FA3|nr:sodium-dependent bicarbonate transport family permease [Aquiluna sp. KACHI24]BDP99675.1 sodium-dependent bicarbonate transport family permease [Aquiluna sp. KACHI24]